MTRVAKTYAPSDAFDESILGRPLKEEPVFNNGREWSISRDSLINGRPASVIPLSRKYEKRKKRRCWQATKLEFLLFFVSIILLITAVGVIIAWSVVSRGFRLFETDTKSNPKDLCVKAEEKPKVCTSAVCAKLAVNFLENMNPSVNPCDDFYEYTCGGFSKRYELPNDKPYYHIIEIVGQNVIKAIRSSLEKEVSKSDSEPTRQTKSIYRSCLSEGVEDANASTMIRHLDEYGGWPVLDEDWMATSEEMNWEKLVVDLLKKHDLQVVLEVNVASDPINTTRHILQFDQATLGLHSRMAYLSGIDNHLLKAYYSMMVDTAVTFGANRTVAERDMLDVINLEIELARISSPDESRRDPKRTYNRFAKSELEKQFPKINFTRIFDTLFPLKGVNVDDVVVVELEFAKHVGNVMEKATTRTINNYLLMRLISHYFYILPLKFRKPFYTFKSVSDGTSGQTPRWEECVELVKRHLPFVVGSMYVKDVFDSRAIKPVGEICNTLKSAFVDAFSDLDWMDSTTKLHAKEKATNIRYHIGHPSWIFNLTKLMEPLEGLTKHDNLMESMTKIRSRRFQIKLHRLNEPKDPEHWFETPALTDAYYVPVRNEMVFPAGIIQFPFFMEGLPKYTTFATVGTIISHEVMHGFDDEGRHYDKDGNLFNWWDEKTGNLFKQKTDCMEKQYGSVFVREVNQTLNGKLTLGENIADNVALKVSYSAFNIWSQQHDEEAKLPGFENFTNRQMFYIAYANNYCSVSRPEYLEFQLETDYHSPSMYRLIVSLQNFADFSETFKCKRNSFMNPEHRCIIM